MTIEELNKQAIKSGYDGIEGRYLDQIAKDSYYRYHIGWDRDYRCWVLEDNTIVGTSHEGFCIVSPKEFEAYRMEMYRVVRNLDRIKETIENKGSED